MKDQTTSQTDDIQSILIAHLREGYQNDDESVTPQTHVAMLAIAERDCIDYCELIVSEMKQILMRRGIVVNIPLEEGPTFITPGITVAQLAAKFAERIVSVAA